MLLEAGAAPWRFGFVFLVLFALCFVLAFFHGTFQGYQGFSQSLVACDYVSPLAFL